VPLTLALIILSVIVSLMTGSVGLGQERSGLIDYLLFTSVDAKRVEAWEAANSEVESETQFLAGYWWSHLRTGQVWRVITPIFLHWSILHLVFNMFWMRDLGAMIETQRGTLRLLGIVLASALISNTAQYFWDGPRFGGMSGVVYALFGYIWVKQRFEPHLGMGLSQQTVWIMVAWLVLAMTGIVGSNIANTAHVVGLVVGAAIAYAPVAARKMKQARRRLE
jgi:GlpG protein